MSRRALLVAVLCAVLCPFMIAQDATAQEDTDLQALQLADQIVTKAAVASNWQVFSEASLGGAVRRNGDSFQPEQRLSFDLQYDNTFTPGWRAVFSDRLDADNPAQQPNNNTINTIREAYLSWQARPDLAFDFGRINVRNGVALGYNPTDFFKTNAVRSFISVDPNSLKQNRQGSVMLRAQELFDSGSVTLLYSPKISDHPSTDSFNPDFAATNNNDRWLISYSPKISEGFNPQFVVYKSEQQPAQFGLSLTSLLNDATVIYAEWSGGRSPLLFVQALQQRDIPVADDTTFRNRYATGLTYTTENKISLTAEYEYNGAGLNQDQWDKVQGAALPVYGLYRNWLNISQESPTKRTVFLYAGWQDAIINHLDLSALEKFNQDDSSRLTWLEARYHLSHTEFALQWQLNSGSQRTAFGASPQTQTWALLGRYYF